MRVHHVNALQALEASVRLGTFRAAGAELGVTAAAVGQQVRKLEDVSGQVLLVRHANGFRATPLARRAAERIAMGLGTLHEAVALIRQGAEDRRLAITVAPTIAEGWLAPRLAAFLGDHPDVDFRIDTTHHVFYRPTGEFDFALRYSAPGTGGGARETDLFPEWLVPVCRAELAPRLRPGDPGDAFGDVPLLHVDRETEDPGWLDWERWGARFGVAIPPRVRGLKFSRSTLALRSMRDGHGLHLAQLSIALPGLVSGQLAAPFGPVGRARTGYRYALVAWERFGKVALHDAFVAWVRAESRRTEEAMAAWLGEMGAP